MPQRCTWTALATLLCLMCAPAIVTAQPKEDARRGDVRLTKAPKLLSGQRADYTKEALDARIEGEVRLKLTIGVGGDVTKVEIVSGPGYGLNEAAAETARKFKFSPAEVNGQPAPVVLPFTIKFELPVLPSEFEGAVVDSGSGEGLAGASVTITYAGKDLPAGTPPPSATGVTDAQGKFSFQNVPAGEYTVALAVDAYKTFTTTITLVAGKKSGATYKVDAKPFNLRGVVKEAGTRVVLPGVRVEAIDPKDPKVVLRETFTDERGAFGFRGLAAGTYTIRVGAKGYITATRKEVVKDGQVVRVEYYAEAQYYDPYTVRTTARRERREVSRQTLTLDETRRIPGTGGDVVRVVQNLPGVARSSFNLGQLIVRGSNPQDSGVFLKGDELPLVFHFLGGPAVVNSEMIQSIDFYPGNFSVYYGRATAGVIDLNTRSPRREGVHGFAEVDLLDSTALIEVPITKDLTFALAGRRSYIDLVLPLVVPEDAGVSVAPYYYDYQSWLTYRGFKNHKLELFVYGSRDELRLTLGEPVGDTDVQFTGINQTIQFHRGQFRWEWKPDRLIENTLMVGFGVGDSDFNVGEQIKVDGDLWTATIREDLWIKPSRFIKLRLGADIQVLSSKFDIKLPGFDSAEAGDPNPAPEGVDLNFNYAVVYPAFYTEAEISPVKGLKIIPGLRMDHYGTISKAFISPRLASRWAISKQWAVKGGVGLFNQPPNPGQTLDNFGNPNLLAEKALHYAAGAEWRPKEFLEFDVTLFYRDMFDLVANTNAYTLDPDTNEPVYQLYNNAGQGRAYGAEVLLRHYPNNRFFGWLAYTLSRSERKDLETGKWETFDFDQTHILTLVAGYNLPWNFDLSAKLQYVTGNPYTPITGGVYSVEEDDYDPILGATNSRRNAPFRQLNLRLDKRFVFESWMLGLFLDVQNVTNADNAEGVLYNYDYTKSAPLRGLPILPVIGVNARF